MYSQLVSCGWGPGLYDVRANHYQHGWVVIASDGTTAGYYTRKQAREAWQYSKEQGTLDGEGAR